MRHFHAEALFNAHFYCSNKLVEVLLKHTMLSMVAGRSFVWFLGMPFYQAIVSMYFIVNIMEETVLESKIEQIEWNYQAKSKFRSNQKEEDNSYSWAKNNPRVYSIWYLDRKIWGKVR